MSNSTRKFELINGLIDATLEGRLIWSEVVATDDLPLIEDLKTQFEAHRGTKKLKLDATRMGGTIAHATARLQAGVNAGGEPVPYGRHGRVYLTVEDTSSGFSDIIIHNALDELVDVVKRKKTEQLESFTEELLGSL